MQTNHLIVLFLALLLTFQQIASQNGANATAGSNSGANASVNAGNGGGNATAGSTSGSNAAVNAGNGGGSANANSTSSSNANVNVNGNGGGSASANSSASSSASVNVDNTRRPTGVSDFPTSDTMIAWPRCFWPWYRFCYWQRECHCALQWPWYDFAAAQTSAQSDTNVNARSENSVAQPADIDDAAAMGGDFENAQMNYYWPQCWFPYQQSCGWVRRCYCRLPWNYWSWIGNNADYAPAPTD
jgi:hypothetical protein